MEYFTVKDETIVEFQEKKSTFIGHVKRVYTEDEAKAFIGKIKTEHKEATHNVPAYVLGRNMDIQRYSDDGEPQGTAGIPVIEVIKKKGISDVAVVITRYYGGILLGAGGLVRAYSKATSMVLDKAGIVQKVEGRPMHITMSYDLFGKIQYICSQYSWHIEDTQYTDKVKVTLFCRLEDINKIKVKITEVTNGKCEFEYDEPKYYFKFENRLFENI